MTYSLGLQKPCVTPKLGLSIRQVTPRRVICRVSSDSERPPFTLPPRQEEAALDSREFGGALCTIILGSVLLGERLNGVGLVRNLELHNDMMHPLLLFSVGGLLAAALWPDTKPKKKQQPETSGLRIPNIAARVSYLGLAGTIIAEMFTGKGALALLDVETGIEALSDVEAVVAFVTMLILTGTTSKKK